MGMVYALRRSREDGDKGQWDEVERGKKILLVFAMGFQIYYFVVLNFANKNI